MNRMILVGILMGTFVHADTIYIHNESDSTFWGATYYIDGHLDRQSAPQEIRPHTTASFERPAFRFDLGGRRFIFSFLKENLKPTLTLDEYHILGNQNIAGNWGDNFYVAFEKGHLECYNRAHWVLFRPVKQHVISPLIACVSALTTGQLRKLFAKPPYDTMQATFRKEITMPAQEKEYRAKRMKKVRAAIQQLTGIAVNDSTEITIAACMSGGGERSALATTGFLVGLEQTNLLNTLTYCATLSGSTWAVGSWTHFGISPSKYQQKIVAQTQKGIITSDFSPIDLGAHLFKKLCFGRSLSLSDMYGGALGHVFLHDAGKSPYEIYLSDQVARIEDGNWLFPIYTGMLTKRPYQWVEFNPYRVGSNYLGGDIPSWAFNREFLNGTSVHTQNGEPPESLGFLFGIFGYAVGVNIQEMFKHFENEIKPEFIAQILTKGLEAEMGRTRLLPAKIWNFTYGVDHLPRSMQDVVTMIDLGILCNLPLQPLLEKPDRAIDLIIIVDNSNYSSSAIGSELLKAKTYFAEKGIEFPEIDMQTIGQKTCTVLKSNSQNMPVLIYLPLIKNKSLKGFDPQACTKDGPCGTFNFTYDAKTAQALIDTVAANVKDSSTIIRQEIASIVNRKQGQVTPKRR